MFNLQCRDVSISTPVECAFDFVETLEVLILFSLGEPVGARIDVSVLLSECTRQHLQYRTHNRSNSMRIPCATKNVPSYTTFGPGWRGAVKILSTVPSVDWVLLGSDESSKGWDFGSLQLQLVCRTHLASWQEKRVKKCDARELQS